MSEATGRVANDTTLRANQPEQKPSLNTVSVSQNTSQEPSSVLKPLLAQHDISLEFGRDPETGQIVVKFIDDKTGDVVRQMPSEVSLALIRAFEKIQGRFVSERI